MASRAELMQLSKADLVDGITRLGQRVKKTAVKAKETAKEVTGVVVSGLGAGAVGALVGMMKARDGYDPQEGVKLFGVDVDLLAGAGLTLVGLTFSKQLGKKNAEYFKWAGAGALSYWFGTFMEDKMIERALNAAQQG